MYTRPPEGTARDQSRSERAGNNSTMQIRHVTCADWGPQRATGADEHRHDTTLLSCLLDRERGVAAQRLRYIATE
ncbi:MAG TPA: hypothetical protein VKE96_31085 [Vicinamibacterales bacterium]|nr:hypothetical protein [Vicinamibacterales bacterium]